MVLDKLISNLLSTVMAPSSDSAAAAPLPATAMDPELLTAARRGDIRLLRDLLKMEDGPAMPAPTAASAALVVVDVVVDGTATPTRPSGAGAGGRQSLLEGVTSRGDSPLHVVAAASPHPRGGGDDDLLQCATAMYSKAKHLLVDRLNNDGDTPLHCAARAGNVRMVSHLISLAARGGGDDEKSHEAAAAATTRAVLRKQNGRKETVLHEAVRFAKEDMVEVLMSTDPELARIPDVGTSPMYLAVSLGRVEIAKLLHRKDGDLLSYSGPHGQNALHAAVLHGKGTTEYLIS